MASVFGASSSFLFSKQQVWGAWGKWAAAWKNWFTVMTMGVAGWRGKESRWEDRRYQWALQSLCCGRRKEDEPLGKAVVSRCMCYTYLGTTKLVREYHRRIRPSPKCCGGAFATCCRLRARLKSSYLIVARPLDFPKYQVPKVGNPHHNAPPNADALSSFLPFSTLHHSTASTHTLPTEQL